jgi:hypothetical protein
MAYPNVWLAFILVAGVGCFCLAASRSGGAPVVAAIAVAFAAASLIRPTDTSVAALPLLAAPLAYAAWRRWWPVAGVAGGLAVGWLAWGIEAHLRYGGFVARLRSGAETNEGGLVFTLPEHLEALDGPILLCRPHDLCAGVSPSATVWWLSLPVLAGIGLVVARHAGWLPAGLLATGSALAVAAQYVFLIDYAAPRFLLPTYALLMIPAATALLWLAGFGQQEARAVIGAVLVLLLLVHVAVQQDLLEPAHASLVRTADNHVRMAEFLRDEHGVGPPCLLWGEGVVQQSYLLKCRSVVRNGQAPAEDDRHIADALASGDTVVLRVRTDAELPESMAGWRRVELPGTNRIVVYLAPPAG